MAKILLVEDDKSLREIYGVRLQAEGYEIVSAGDGEEALALAIKERPDLIVSDVMMPKISGFDMLDILRSTTETKDIKVIMMTALSSEDQRARGEALGADRYLVKSQVGIEDVVRTVHDVLGDGVPGAAPAPSSPAPAAPASSAPAPAPMPDPTPAPSDAPDVTPQDAPGLVPEPVMPTPPAAPVSDPTPVMTPNGPAPAVPSPSIDELSPMPATAPTEPPVINLPPTPAPAMPDPVPAAMPVPAPAPVLTTPLPEPTAPFSSPRPASLGDRVINPISPMENTAAPLDIAAQMNQELAAQTTPAPTPMPDVPETPAMPPQEPTPAPMPTQPELPPLPPQPPTPPAPAPTQTV